MLLFLKRNWAWVLGGIGLLLIMGVLIISDVSAGRLLAPEREMILETPKDFGISFQEVAFVTSDAITIRGWYVPAMERSHATILLTHGYLRNRAQTNEHIHFLHQQGFNILAFDFRGHGESGGTYTTLGANEIRDVEAAIHWLKRTHPDRAKKIGILGLSMGGAVAILAAAQNPQIDAVVVDSTFARLSNAIDSSFTHFAHLPAFPFSPVTVQLAQWKANVDIGNSSPVSVVAAISPRPVFIIHSKVDKIIPYKENALLLYSAAKEPKSLWIVEGGGHVNNLESVPVDYHSKVSLFFKKFLK